MGTAAMMDQGYAPQPGGVLLGNVNYIPPGFESFYKEPFTYNVVFSPSTHAAGAQSQSTNIQNDSFFVCVSQYAWIVDHATGNTTITDPTKAAMLVRTLDTSSGKYAQDQATPIGNLFGTAENPFVWLYRAKVYLPGGQLTVELTNNMSADQDVRLSFAGFKVYRTPDSSAQM